MVTTARLDLSVWRNDDVYELPVIVRGLDLTGLTMAFQARAQRDTPGAPLINLTVVTNGNAEGLRLAGVTSDNGVPVSDLRIRINKSTRQALPYVGELGDDAALEYALVIDRQTRLVGRLIILAHAFGSDFAPTDRPESYGLSRGGSAPAGSISMTIAGQEVVQLSIDGTAAALIATDRAVSAQTAAQASSAKADIAAAAAQVFVGGKLYDSTALGLAGTSSGQFFAVPGTPRRATVDVYKNQSGTAAKQLTYGSKLISADEFPSGPADAATYAQGVNADIFLPAGDFTGDLPDTSDAIFEGDGRLFNAAGVQTSTYAEPRSRFVIGQEYLWGFQFRARNGLLTSSTPIVFAGDSTTRGAFAQSSGGSLPEPDKIHRINEDQMVRYGIYGPESINSGMDGVTAREWLNGVQVGGKTRGLDYDMATYPDMVVYVIRFGINDGSQNAGYHDIDAYRRDIRAALQKIRAWRPVNELSILLMTPNSVSETGARDEAWMEQVARVLKKAARDYLCCFIDTYALWRDARGQAVGKWRDNVQGAGIHPEGVANRQIMDVVGEVLYRPISLRRIATNTFLNAPGSATRPITIATAPNDPLFAAGDCTYRTDAGNTFPLDGNVRTFKTGDGLMVQQNFGYANDNAQRIYTRFGLDGGAWSDWRGLEYPVPFTKDNGAGGWVATGWSDYGAGTSPLAVSKSVEGLVLVHGRVKNTGAAAGSVIATLPEGYRPLVEKPILALNHVDSSVGLILLTPAGALIWYSGSNADVSIDFTFKSFR